MEDSQGVFNQLDLILELPTLSSEDLSIMIQDLYHECACNVLQPVMLRLLTVMLQPGFSPSVMKGAAVDLTLSMAKAVLQTLALPISDQSSGVPAAQAIKQELIGRQLSWDHLEKNHLTKAGELQHNRNTRYGGCCMTEEVVCPSHAHEPATGRLLNIKAVRAISQVQTTLLVRNTRLVISHKVVCSLVTHCLT